MSNDKTIQSSSETERTVILCVNGTIHRNTKSQRFKNRHCGTNQGITTLALAWDKKVDLLTQSATNDSIDTRHTVASAMSGEVGSELGLAWFSPTNMRKGASTLMLLGLKTPQYHPLYQPLFLHAPVHNRDPAFSYHQVCICDLHPPKHATYRAFEPLIPNKAYPHELCEFPPDIPISSSFEELRRWRPANAPLLITLLYRIIRPTTPTKWIFWPIITSLTTSCELHFIISINLTYPQHGSSILSRRAPQTAWISLGSQASEPTSSRGMDGVGAGCHKEWGL